MLSKTEAYKLEKTADESFKKHLWKQNELLQSPKREWPAALKGAPG